MHLGAICRRARSERQAGDVRDFAALRGGHPQLYSRAWLIDAVRVAGIARRGPRQLLRCCLAGADAALSCCATMPATPCRPDTARWACRPSSSQRHIAYDIGAASVTRALAEALGAPAVMTRYSRLLIDPNRGRDDPTLIMRLSDGAIVPGNRRLDEAERERRLRLYYEPYHRAIDAVIDRCLATGVTPVLLSIHSFTESWKDRPRPWHVGVLWDGDRAAGPAAARGASTPRATSSSATTSLIRASSRATACGSTAHQPGSRQRAHRGPPGPDPRRRGPGRVGRPRSCRIVGVRSSVSREKPAAAAQIGIAASALRPEGAQATGAAPRRGCNAKGDAAMTKIDNRW